MKTNEELKKIIKDDEDYKSLSQEEKIEWMSLNIFNKNSKDLKYLLCTNYIHQQLLDEHIARTGLYQWINVFNGKVSYPRDVEDYNEYDLVQVNLSTQDIPLVPNIKKQITGNTKLIANNDYTTEAWAMAFGCPTTFEREINFADMIFGTEYFQCTAVSEITGRKCFVIPHPADIKRLKSIPTIPKKNIISTIWRRYDNHSYIPSLAVRNHGLTTQLLGYDKSKDPKTWLTTTLFDYVYAGTNFFDFCDQLRESKIVYDPFTFHSYSRATVDTAALGVAVVGSNRTQSSQICYPFTTIDPYDVHSARMLIQRLNEDNEFYKKVVDTALERSEYYNHLNSKERYLSALYESQLESKETKQIKKIKSEPIKGNDVLKEIAKELNRNEKENEGKSQFRFTG